MPDLGRIGRESPGHLELQLAGPQVRVRSIVDELPAEERSERADLCNYLLVLVQGDPRYAKAVLSLLDSVKRTYLHQLQQDLDDVDTGKARGALNAVRVMEKVLTDPESLAETRKEMLGLTDSPEGDMANAR